MTYSNGSGAEAIMTKVIKHGDNWFFKREAYNGRRVTCKSCKCAFEITPTSRVSHATEGNQASGRVTCPECGVTENKIIIAKRLSRYSPMKPY